MCTDNGFLTWILSWSVRKFYGKSFYLNRYISPVFCGTLDDNLEFSDSFSDTELLLQVERIEGELHQSPEAIDLMAAFENGDSDHDLVRKLNSYEDGLFDYTMTDREVLDVAREAEMTEFHSQHEERRKRQAEMNESCLQEERRELYIPIMEPISSDEDNER